MRIRRWIFPALLGLFGIVTVDAVLLGDLSHRTPTPILLSVQPSAGCASGRPVDPRERVAYDPFIAAGPTGAGTDHSTLAAVWTARDLLHPQTEGHTALSVSRDGGATWTAPRAAFLSCAGSGPSFAATVHPWVSIGPDGTVYLTALGERDGGSTALLAATSAGGGRSWGRTRVVDVSTAGTAPDQPTVTADPRRKGVAYLVWDRVKAGGQEPGRASLWLAVTTDGGLSWRRHELLPAGRSFSAVGGRVLVDRSGARYLTFLDVRTVTHTSSHPVRVCATAGRKRACRMVRRRESRTTEGVGFMRSDDGGVSWSAPRDLAAVTPGDFPAWRPFRTGFAPDAALDPRTGRLYVVWWQPGAQSGSILLSSSRDGGRHWTAPERVNRPADGPAFTPAAAVNTAGRVAVTYFSHVAAVKGQRYPTRYWLRSSTDGRTFGAPLALTDVFDHARALSEPGGAFLGEYMGLAADGPRFHAIFIATTRPRDRGDAFTLSLSS